MITTLDAVIGHEGAKRVLERSLESGRVHHAWVFAGPKGVGKRTAAVAFAAMLLDETLAPDLTGRLNADETSEVQRLVRAEAHPDLHIIDRSLAQYSEDRRTRESKLTSIPKEVIETRLLEPLARAATRRTDSTMNKVFIIDEAELLDRSRSHAPVQASLLKTLEEPPPGTVVILVTSSEDRLLTTVRSRCQRVSFGALTDEEMRAWWSSMSLEADGEELAFAMRFAHGSPGRVLEALDAGLWEWERALAPMLDRAMRGGPPGPLGETMAGLIDEWAGERVSSKGGVSKESLNREGATLLVMLLSERARTALREANDDAMREAALASIEALGVFERQVASNVSMKLAAERLAVSWGAAEAVV